MKLGKMEQALYDYILKSRKKEISITELANHYYKTKSRPDTWRGSVAAVMRTLMLKSQVDKKLRRITRASRLGRSAMAVYKMNKGK